MYVTSSAAALEQLQLLQPQPAKVLRTGKEIRFRFWLSEDKAGKEAQHQKRSAQRSAFLVLG